MNSNHSAKDQHLCEACLFKRLSTNFISTDDFCHIEKHTQQLRYKKGDTILKQGANTTHLVFLFKGIVKFEFENTNGKNLILTVVSAPKLLGGANMFYKDQNLFSICAVEDCDVCFIELNVFREILLKNSRYALMLFEKASEMFKVSILNFISLAHKQIHGRIADILIYLAESVYCSRRFDLSLTRKELADFAGCSQENVIITLSKFKKEGIIKMEKKDFEIVDYDKLLTISKIG